MDPIKTIWTVQNHFGPLQGQGTREPDLLFKDLNDEDSTTDPYFVIADRDDDLTLLKEADIMEFLAKPGNSGISGGISDCFDFFTELL